MTIKQVIVVLFACWHVTTSNRFNAKFINGLDYLEDRDETSFDQFADKSDHTWPEYSLDVGVKLKKDFSDDLVSDLFATSYGLEKIARLSELDRDGRMFHFKLPRASNQGRHRVRRHVENKIDLLRQDDRVEFVFPQSYLSRHKRSLPDDDIYKYVDRLLGQLDQRKVVAKRKKMMDTEHQGNQSAAHLVKNLSLPDAINFNDQEYKMEWYLINEGQFSTPPQHDMNVKEAWLNGYTGKNVTIVIVDDGLDYEHPDFEGKYRADLSYDFNDETDEKHDPMPSTFDDQNNHGTRCAGAAVANANNSVCGVGIAYDAQIGGIRILDGPITDLLEARALSYKASKVHIRSASWGPKDDGTHIEYPGPLVNLALESGVKFGRNGKGTLFVWASGNGGGNGDDCSCDGYVSHWNIISIGSINHRGLTPFFMELCPSTMAVVYSGGQTSRGEADEDDPGVRVVASDVRGKCTTMFQGTSSAAPLAAGALALVLEANPDLTYRDVMHLIAKTARIPNMEDKKGWLVNGAGFHVNEKYGFGVLDVGQMIQEAQSWQNVPERQKCMLDYEGPLPNLIAGDAVKITLDVQGCDNIDKLEHVVANVSFEYAPRGEIKMTLISPHGTPSEILSYRRNDRGKAPVRNFPFMTVFNWGESPKGKWTLVIETQPADLVADEDKKKIRGRITSFSMVFMGHESPPSSERSNEKRFADKQPTEAYEPSDEQVVYMYKRELKKSRESRIINKRLIDENPELKYLIRD